MGDTRFMIDEQELDLYGARLLPEETLRGLDRLWAAVMSVDEDLQDLDGYEG